MADNRYPVPAAPPRQAPPLMAGQPPPRPTYPAVPSLPAHLTSSMPLGSASTGASLDARDAHPLRPTPQSSASTPLSPASAASAPQYSANTAFSSHASGRSPHEAPVDLVRDFLRGRDFPQKHKFSSAEVHVDSHGIQMLAENGDWREVIKLADKLLKSNTLSPYDMCQVRLSQMTALMKMRMFEQAASEFDAFGDLNAPQHQYERYHPSMYATKKGSMIPFSLRVLYAELPHFFGNTRVSLDRLYLLLSAVKKIMKSKRDAASAKQQQQSAPIIAPAESAPAPVSATVIQEPQQESLQSEEIKEIEVKSEEMAISLDASSSSPESEGIQEFITKSDEADEVKATPPSSSSSSSVSVSVSSSSPVSSPAPSLPASLSSPPPPPPPVLAAPVASSSSDSDNEPLSLWIIRERRILFSIINLHVSMRDYNLALQHLTRAAAQEPQDDELQSRLGRLQLIMGDLATAKSIFAKIEAQFERPESSVNVLLNRGFLAMAGGQYSVARDSFGAAVLLDPRNITAVNNRSVALLYMGKLRLAISSIEDVLRSSPQSLDSTLATNLSILYDMETELYAQQQKDVVRALSQRYKPDDFYMMTVSQTGFLQSGNAMAPGAGLQAPPPPPISRQ